MKIHDGNPSVGIKQMLMKANVTHKFTRIGAGDN